MTPSSASPYSLSLLNEQQTAKYYNCSVALLRKWRFNGNGPTHLKMGGRLVRYRQADLDAFLHQVALEAGR